MEHHDDAQLEALNTALPVGCIQVNRMRTLFGSEAGIFIPFNVKECQMTKRPLFYGINKESKQPILLNRKELTNGNGFVLAPPGFGKSFNGAKFEIGGVLMNETDDVIIFDPANEYIDVVNAYGGAVLAFSDTSNNCINPFDFDEERLRSGDMDSRELNRIIKDKAQMMFAICQGILKELFNIHHKNIIDRSVRILYHAIAEMKPEEMRMPIMSDFYDVIRLQEGNEARDLAESLEMFVDGSLNMFNHPTNIDVHNRITTFSVRDIDEELWLPAMAIIFDFTTKRLVSNFEKGIATRLYTDEFHIFADDEYTCKYLIRCWRQWRKFQGFCTGITQNIKTVLANPKLATLISNSEYLMLLHQADDDFAVMLNTFTWMTEAHRNYLMNARPGEGIIKAGNIVIPFDNRVPKDSYVYSIYSTNAVEKAEQSS
ncbi:MAG: hypothetical protein LUH14_07975 [Clostridiaceae bacterium]|nr:hypothetical protein [Clostridiaceae bacterium]